MDSTSLKSSTTSSSFDPQTSSSHHLGTGLHQHNPYHHHRLTTVWTPTPMSPARRACVLASVMLGILVTVVFVWVMPCGVDDLCGVAKVTEVYPGAAGEFVNNYKDAWMQVFENTGSNHTIAIIGERGLVPDILMVYYQPPNSTDSPQLWDSLLQTADCEDSEGDLIDRNDGLLNDSNDPCRKNSGRSFSDRSRDGATGPLYCGLMLLRGSSGQMMWTRHLNECPALTLCHLMEGPEVSDCLILGPLSMMMLIAPLTGKVIWEMPQVATSNSTNKTDAVLLYPGRPVLVPDVTGDGKPDLLFPGIVKSAEEASSLLYAQSHKASSGTDDKRSTPSHKYRDLDASSIPPISIWTSTSTSRGHRKEYNNHQSTLVNELVLVSGATGKIVGSPFTLVACHTLTQISIDGESVDYSCLMDSGSKLDGKIPMVSVIHDILGPHIFTNNTRSPSVGYPSLTPFVPTPDSMTYRYCQVEVVNKGQCPLCESRIKLMSSSEVESLWQVEYDGSIILDWEPLVSGSKCIGLVLKVIAWDEISDIEDLDLAEGTLVGNQRTTRSSYGNAENDDEEDFTDTEGGFSGVGEENDYENTKKKTHKSTPLRFWLQDDEPTRKRTAKFTDSSDGISGTSTFYNAPYYHMRHNHLWPSNNLLKGFTSQKRDSANKRTSEDYFEHPTIHFHNGKQASIGRDTKQAVRDLKHDALLPKNKKRRIQKKSENLEKVPPKLAALYAKELDDQSLESEITEEDDFSSGEIRHTTLDFELPINIFGLPIDTQPPEGFSLQKLTEYILLVHYNGTEWVDVPLTKTPIFQLCKDSVCIPNAKYSSKMVVHQVWGQMHLWSAVNTVTTVAQTQQDGPGETQDTTATEQEAYSATSTTNSKKKSKQATPRVKSDNKDEWTVKTFVSKILIAP